MAWGQKVSLGGQCPLCPPQIRLCIILSIIVFVQLVQQKDGVQTELTQMSLAKTKLESLCRELQKHSKAVVVSELCIRVMSYLRTYIVHLFMSFYALHNVHRVQYTGVFVHCPYMVYCNVLYESRLRAKEEEERREKFKVCYMCTIKCVICEH